MEPNTETPADNTYTFTLKRRDIYIVVGLVCYVWGHRRGVRYGRSSVINEQRHLNETRLGG